MPGVIRKVFLGLACLLAVLISASSVLYVRNPPPAVPVISIAESIASGKPYVVKLHAQWCPVCMFTKDMWVQIEKTYSGRVNLVVFDFTNQATTDRSKAEAKRLGLEKFFDDNVGSTGIIAVLDPHTREETASIRGSHNFADYRSAIDGSLQPVTR
jgi:thiol-disulfide isomerase/thioredoxin